MTIKSKRSMTSMISSILLIAAYIFYASGRRDVDSLKSWAIAMLVFIGITIGAQIIIQIFFHIFYAVGLAVREGSADEGTIDRAVTSSMMDDEMDKLISLKSSQIAYIAAGAGFMAVLVALIWGASSVLALNIMFLSFAAGSIISEGVSIFFYERGV